MVIEWIIGAIIAGLIGAAIVLAMITTAAIIECARGWWGTGTHVVVVDPATSSELERIAAQKGSLRHKRFVYHRSNGTSELVESNSISSDLAYRSRVELYVS